MLTLVKSKEKYDKGDNSKFQVSQKAILLRHFTTVIRPPLSLIAYEYKRYNSSVHWGVLQIRGQYLEQALRLFAVHIDSDTE